MMFLVDIERFAMLGQYKELSESLAQDPGVLGLLVLVCLVCLNVFMQVAVRTFSARWFRVATVYLTAAYAAFFLLHQVAHVVGGEPLGLHTPLDFTHHLLGIWGLWGAWQWSKDA
jgi:hypothetical protein